MNHIPIILEHVDLLNGLDGLDIEFLERTLEFLVVCAGCFVYFADYAPGGAFSSVG